MNEEKEFLENCTDEMSIEISNVPKEICINLTTLIGALLNEAGLKFDYGGIGKGFTNKICGVEFEIEQ